ncbi:MAG: copper resistance protein CopC [Actinomycetes bacterium]
MTAARPRPARTAALAVLLAVAALLLGPATPASAHAAIVETTPADGAQVDAVDEVRLRFNEAVTVPTGGIRVYDASGERVDDGTASLDGSDTVVAPLSGLADGTFVATYRITSEDGHVVRGALVFTVGDAPGGIDEGLLASLVDAGDSPVVAALGVVVRAGTHLALLVLGGALLALVRVVSRDDDRSAARAWARRAAWATVGLSLLAVPVQSMAVTGLGPVAALAPAPLGETLAATVGQAAVLRLLAAGAVLLLLGRAADTVVLGAAGLALASLLLDGHTRTVEPAWLMWTADAVHVAAGAAWLGGLVVLAGALRRRRLADDPVGGAGLVARFSAVATVALVAVVVAGSAMSWATVQAPRALLSTSYGVTLLVKLAIAAAVIAAGAHNHRRLVPDVVAAVRPVPAGGSSDTVPDAVAGTAPGASLDDGEAAWSRLRRTVRLEVLGLAVLLVVTGVLVQQRPAAEAAGITGLFEARQPLGDELALDVVVDPNRAGFNQIHLYVLDATGRPTDDIEGITVELTPPGEAGTPLVREPFVAGPGHWQVNGRELAFPGRWTIEVVVRVDTFTEARSSVDVVVNP